MKKLDRIEESARRVADMEQRHWKSSGIAFALRAARQFGTALRELAKQEYEAEDHRLDGTGRTFAQFIQQEWDIDIDLAEMIAEKEQKLNEPA